MPTTEYPEYQLLDDQDRATFLSHFLGSHRAFRRDAARFPVALRRIGEQQDRNRAPEIDALRRHWASYEAALAYHHHMEDELLFPSLRSIDASLGEVIDRLVVQHNKQDGTIAQVAEVLGLLPAVEAVEPAAQTFEDLAATLNSHLDLEEQHLVPVLRTSGLEPDAGGADEGEGQAQHRQPDDTAITFVMPWVADGLDDDTVTALLDTLPPPLRTAFPHWQANYTDQLSRWWW